MAQGRGAVDGDRTVRVGVAEQADVGTAKSLEPIGRTFGDFASGLDLVVQQCKRSEASGSGQPGDSDRVEQVQASVGAKAIGRPLRPDQDNWECSLEREVQEVGGFLECGGAVGDHRTG